MLFRSNAILGVLGNNVTLRVLTGLKTGLATATPQDLAGAFDTMRLSNLPSTRLVYQVLRSVTCMAFFTQSENWSLTGYPGPVEI